MRTKTAMGLAVILLIGANAVKGDDMLQGAWILKAGEADGKALTEKQIEEGKLLIEGDHYRVTLDGGETITGVQKLDSTSAIKMIDIMDDTGRHKGHMCLGIYELKGDEFRVAFAPPGKERPTKFVTAPDSGYWAHTWKRIKK
ncbi:MAG: TIGR03067 domain-containing protein [Planctomycetaceae bacterium]